MSAGNAAAQCGSGHASAAMVANGSGEETTLVASTDAVAMAGKPPEISKHDIEFNTLAKELRPLLVLLIATVGHPFTSAVSRRSVKSLTSWSPRTGTRVSIAKRPRP